MYSITKLSLCVVENEWKSTMSQTCMSVIDIENIWCGLNIFISNQFIQYNAIIKPTNIRIRTEAKAYQVLLLYNILTKCRRQWLQFCIIQVYGLKRHFHQVGCIYQRLRFLTTITPDWLLCWAISSKMRTTLNNKIQVNWFVSNFKYKSSVASSSFKLRIQIIWRQLDNRG